MDWSFLPRSKDTTKKHKIKIAVKKITHPLDYLVIWFILAVTNLVRLIPNVVSPFQYERTYSEKF